MNNEEAFGTLLTSLTVALNESLSRHSKAALRGDLKALEAETDLQRKLVAVRNQLQGLRDDWPLPIEEKIPAAMPKARRPKKRSPQVGKLKRGRRTPQIAYYLPILRTLEELGGRGAVADVLDRVGNIMADQLNQHDLALLKSGGVRWRNAAQWARHGMRQKGLIADDSPRGIWEITEQGRRYLREQGG